MIARPALYSLNSEGHDRSKRSQGEYCASHQLGRLAWSDAPIFKTSGLGVLRRNQQSHISNEYLSAWGNTMTSAAAVQS